MDVDRCRSDNFDQHIIHRAKILLDSIEGAAGKAISGRNTEDVIKMFTSNTLLNPLQSKRSVT